MKPPLPHHMRPTLSGRPTVRRNYGLGEVHERAPDGRCHCGMAWELHPMDVIDISSAKIAGALRGLPRAQQRLTIERRERQSAPNVEVARGGQWVRAGFAESNTIPETRVLLSGGVE